MLGVHPLTKFMFTLCSQSILKIAEAYLGVIRQGSSILRSCRRSTIDSEQMR